MKRAPLAAVIAAALLCSTAASAQGGALSDAEITRVEAAVKTLRPARGLVTLGDAKVRLDLGNRYEFYDAAAARTIIVDVWRNPPDSMDGVLGIVLPARASPLSDTWGAVISFDASGHVSDEDAETTDFDELLANMQAQARERNQEREAAGYPALTIEGWAQRPDYDPATHSIVWARELRFAGDEQSGLNYDVRTLGRYGTLSVNFVSDMSRLSAIDTAARELAGRVRFDPGAQYEDYNSWTDDSAGYGIAGLVGAGAAAGVAKKAGLAALIAKFGKVIFAGIAALVLGALGQLRRLFSGRRAGKPQDYDGEDPKTPTP